MDFAPIVFYEQWNFICNCSLYFIVPDIMKIKKYPVFEEKFYSVQLLCRGFFCGLSFKYKQIL